MGAAHPTPTAFIRGRSSPLSVSCGGSAAAPAFSASRLSRMVPADVDAVADVRVRAGSSTPRDAFAYDLTHHRSISLRVPWDRRRTTGNHLIVRLFVINSIHAHLHLHEVHVRLQCARAGLARCSHAVRICFLGRDRSGGFLLDAGTRQVLTAEGIKGDPCNLPCKAGREMLPSNRPEHVRVIHKLRRASAALKELGCIQKLIPGHVIERWIVGPAQFFVNDRHQKVGLKHWLRDAEVECLLLIDLRGG
jgi:hypothetical protein